MTRPQQRRQTSLGCFEQGQSSTAKMCHTKVSTMDRVDLPGVVRNFRSMTRSGAGAFRATQSYCRGTVGGTRASGEGFCIHSGELNTVQSWNTVDHPEAEAREKSLYVSVSPFPTRPIRSCHPSSGVHETCVRIRILVDVVNINALTEIRGDVPGISALRPPTSKNRQPRAVIGILVCILNSDRTNNWDEWQGF